MSDQRGPGGAPARSTRSRIRDKASLVAGLLGLATAVALGILLYIGRDYTEQTEPSWWWNALILCGLGTGLFGLLSIAFNPSDRPGAPRPLPQPPGATPPPPSQPWEDIATEAVPTPALAAPNSERASSEAPPGPVGYTAVYRREEQGWVTEVEEVPGCSVRAPTLYAARAGILEALAGWLGGPVDGREVVDDVELPQEVADAVSRAGSARGSYDAEAQLTYAASVLVNQFALDTADAAALLGVSYEEVQDALNPAEEPAGDGWAPEEDDRFSPWGAGSSAP